jgi:hypothetical protein
VCKKKEGVGFVVSSNKISGKGAHTPMRVKNITQRSQVFVQGLQESFGGDFQVRTREMLRSCWKVKPNNGWRIGIEVA